MRILIVDIYYEAFLHSFYEKHPDLPCRLYSEQQQALMAEGFGTADFYSRSLNLLGHEATEVVANCEPLQRRWAQENGLALDEALQWSLALRRKFVPWPHRKPREDWFYTILAAQVKQYKPDVLYIHDMNYLSARFVREIKPYVRLTVGQIACPILPGRDFREYDLIISSFPHFVEQFQQAGRQSEYLKIGFEAGLLSGLKSAGSWPVSFVGGLSADHSERIGILETVAAEQPVDFWGYGDGALRPSSPLRANYHGQAWGREMYEILHGSQITLNHHINVAGEYANNCRLFEATGSGAMLVTDWKKNLSEMLEPGKEVAAYRSPEECREMIIYYLSHEEERKTIAEAGQKRTLREHTYSHRMQELTAILAKHLAQRQQ